MVSEPRSLTETWIIQPTKTNQQKLIVDDQEEKSIWSVDWNFFIQINSSAITSRTDKDKVIPPLIGDFKLANITLAPVHHLVCGGRFLGWTEEMMLEDNKNWWNILPRKSTKCQVLSIDKFKFLINFINSTFLHKLTTLKKLRIGDNLKKCRVIYIRSENNFHPPIILMTRRCWSNNPELKMLEGLNEDDWSKLLGHFGILTFFFIFR